MTGFWGEVIRKALGPDQVGAAIESGQAQGRATLDDAELRELERAEYYAEAPAVIEDATAATSPRRSILDRLLRR